MPTWDVSATEKLVSDIYDKAHQHEWTLAAILCREVVSQVESTSESAQLAPVIMLSAKCHYKAAFQTNSRSGFNETMTFSKVAYEKARALYESAHESAMSTRAQAGTKLAEFWLQSRPDERMLLALSAVELYNRSVEEFECSRKSEEVAETKLELLAFFPEFVNLATDIHSLKRLFDEGLQLAEETIRELRKSSHVEDLVVALNITIWLRAVEAQVVLPPSEFQALSQKTMSFRDQLESAARELGTSYATCLARESLGHVAFDVLGDPSGAFEHYESSLGAGKGLQDALLLGRLHWLLAHAASWLARTETDDVRRRKLFERSASFASNAIENLQIPLQTTALAAAHANLASCNIELADQADLIRRRETLERAIKQASQGTSYESGTWAWSLAASTKAKALQALSKLEDPQQKQSLLKEALELREQTANVTSRLFPTFWTPVRELHQLALVRVELAGIQQDYSARESLLNQAITSMELCLKLGSKWATNPGFLYRLAQCNDSFGHILTQYYYLTQEHSVAHNAIKAYEDAIDLFRNSLHIAPTAALRWKVAKIYDELGQAEAASNQFVQAAEAYRKGAYEVPGSASVFQDLARYMDVWAVVETARLHHREARYDDSSELYFSAARRLEEINGWSHLAPTFLARSELEKGEALSAGEKHAKAIEAFEKAVKGFQNATGSLEKKLDTSPEGTDREELQEWLGLARQRTLYCRGRLSLEEARALDKKGEKRQSAGKYLDSSQILGELSRDVSSQDRPELRALGEFCKAWARMKQAELTASPELYSQAADSFLEAKTADIDDQLQLLAVANASICRALSAGTQFRQTRDAEKYATIKTHLETAADYYREAGFRKTESWTRAYQRLFDALVFASAAEVERDPNKKTESYNAAEKHFRLAAKLFGNAGFPLKKREALLDLKRVLEEKQVLLTALQELSQVPTTTGSPIGTIPKGGGKPIGYERFEEAYVVGDISLTQTDVLVGSDFTFELDIANVGRTNATLIKMIDTAPIGLSVNREKTPQTSEDGSLDLQGRRLEHLKTHRAVLTLTASRKGTYALQPKVYFADEQGNYKSFRFPPATLSVLDLGRPEQQDLALEQVTHRVDLPKEFRFETDRSRDTFRFLVNEFLKDYVSKRLQVEVAGWRSFVTVVREVKIPRSSFYGPQGRVGPILAELERRGLAETRIFPKERGRGGSVKRIRVTYGNAVVKSIVERSLMESR